MRYVLRCINHIKDYQYTILIRSLWYICKGTVFVRFHREGNVSSDISNSSCNPTY